MAQREKEREQVRQLGGLTGEEKKEKEGREERGGVMSDEETAAIPRRKPKAWNPIPMSW